jgi:hypothetical protein
MNTATRLTLAEYERLPGKEGTHYELDEGTLLMERAVAGFASQPHSPEDRGAIRCTPITELESLTESRLFDGFNFSLALAPLFDDVFRQ